MNIKAFDNEKWQAEALKLFMSIKRKRIAKLIIVCFAFLCLLVYLCCLISVKTTAIKIFALCSFGLSAMVVFYHFLKLLFDDICDTWYVEIGKYIISQLEICEIFSINDYENLGRYFSNVDSRKILKVRNTTLSEIIYFKYNPQLLLNATTMLSFEKQNLFNYFADESISLETKQKVALNKWGVDKITSRYGKIHNFMQGCSQYEANIIENIFFAENEKVFEKALL